MGRYRDAVRTLLGRSESQIELAKMRAEFADLMLVVSNAMEKLKTATLKFARRDAAALGDSLTEDPEVPSPEHSTKWDARAEVMKRGRRARTIQPEAADVSSDQSRTG